MKRRLLITLAVLAVLAIPVGIVMVPRLTDIAPIDDSDLALPGRQVDPAQNPFPEFRSFVVGADLKEQFHSIYERRAKGTADERGVIEALLNSQAENLKRFETVAAQTGWKEDRQLQIDSNVDYLSSWLELARFKARVETAHLAETGQVGEAVESALSILTFGGRLQQAEGGLIHQFSAMSIATEGLHSILRLVESGRLDRNHLDRIALVLSELTFDPEDFAQGHIVEYLTFKNVIDDLAAGRVQITQLAQQLEEGGPAPRNFSFKRNRTRKLLADAFRQFISEALMTWSEAPLENSVTSEKIRSAPGMMNVSGNRIGWILYCITVPTGDEINERHAIFRASMELLRVRIALERFRFESGDWPADLAELVPDFLPAVPADPMDGKPLRYSRQSGVIYSVGTNFIDQKGEAPGRSGNLESAEEMVIRLEPAEKTTGS